MESWVAVSNETGLAVFETYNRRAAKCINTARYTVLTSEDYLIAINARIQAGQFVDNQPISSHPVECECQWCTREAEAILRQRGQQ
jgi:hypothetical protein